MHRGNGEKRDDLSRRSLLRAIGEAGVAASVLDPYPTFHGRTTPVHRFSRDVNGMNATRTGSQEEHGSGEDKRKHVLPGFEERCISKKALPTCREEGQKGEFELSRYDHAA